VIRATILAIVMILAATLGAAQDQSPIRCVITMYRSSGEKWRLTKSVEFVPQLGEEELTNKRIRLPGRMWLLASVFPTDESMYSAKGADSLKLGVSISKFSANSAFDIDNNAVAEATLATLDTLRVERTTHVNRKPMLARLECWDANLEKKRSD
jgi:hypothetical protein